MVYVIGCSVKGEKHDQNQDAWEMRRISDSRFAISVADGLGSAKYSHKGSQIATETIVNELEKRFDELEGLENEQTKAEIHDAFVSTRNTLLDKTEELEGEISDFGTTLLAAVVGTSGTIAGAVGDGGIVGHSEGEHMLLVDREETEYANVTTPLTRQYWDSSYRVGTDANIDSVALFTDGIDNFTWGLENPNEPREEFFDQIFTFAREIDETNGEEPKLCEFLNDSHFKEYSKDDKTLAIGVATDQQTSESDQSKEDPSEENSTKQDSRHNDQR